MAGLGLEAVGYTTLLQAWDMPAETAFIHAMDQVAGRFGRHVLAVGGNAEAARRTGIQVDNDRLVVFTLAGTLAVAGGIMAASRLFAVNQSSGGADTLLNVIAAAVIGGTSLFGGRGSAYSALLGAVVIVSIENGIEPARCGVVDQVPGHRRGAAARGHRRRHPGTTSRFGRLVVPG